MTNYEWLVRRIVNEVDTPEKLTDSLLKTALSFGGIADEVNHSFCKVPKGTECVYWTHDGCAKCVKAWLSEEHDG